MRKCKGKVFKGLFKRFYLMFLCIYSTQRPAGVNAGAVKFGWGCLTITFVSISPVQGECPGTLGQVTKGISSTAGFTSPLADCTGVALPNGGHESQIGINGRLHLSSQGRASGCWNDGNKSKENCGLATRVVRRVG